MNNIFEEEYNKLNKAQKEVVESIYGPIMVVAGPGTGKTQIIGLRTANIILKAKVNPNNILITTFTEAGVIAIKQRLVKFLGNEGYKVSVSTIHSLSQEIIKTFPEKFIEYKAGRLIDELEQLEAIKSIIDQIDNSIIEKLIIDYDKYFYLREIKSKISILKQEGISIEKFKISIKNQEKKFEEELNAIKPTLKKYETTKEKNQTNIKKLNELVIFYEEYEKYLRLNSFYDFNDIINFVLEKLNIDTELKHYFAEKYQFIMLDEFQDTNNAQNQIIDLILSINDEQPNIMVVGDDDQSIYRFQGANIENMLDFSSKYKDTKFIVLEENYRSNQQILDLSSSLIGNNNERLTNKIKTINKTLISSSLLKNSKNTPKLFNAINDLEEKTFIINQIKNLLEQNKNPQEIAIIVRNNREVEEWTHLLNQNNIKTESKLKTNILNSDYIKFIVNFLKLINNPYENEDILINLLRTKIIGLNQIDILKINRKLYIENYTKKIKLTLIDYLIDENKLDELELEDKNSLIKFREELLELGSLSKEINFIDFFSKFIEKIGILNFIEKNGSFDDIQDIFTLFNKIKDWNNNIKNITISNIINKIELYNNYNYPIQRQILIENKLGVNILTAHSSKGLEFDTVFIPGLYNGNWDEKKVTDKIKLPNGIVGNGLQELNFDQIEEDRRLFFVAVTRAKDNLYLSYPNGIGIKPLFKSLFIEEIEDKVEKIEIGDLNKHIEEVVKNSIKNNLIEHTNLEFDYIKNFLTNYKLSPSDLNTFIEDPILFLNKAIFKYPFIDNQYTIFGKVYHRALELFYLKYKNEGIIPEKSYLTSTFKLLLEKENITPEEYEKMLEKGVNGLNGYYELYSQKGNEPLILEYSFSKKDIVFNSIPLTGKIDKIEKIGTINNKDFTKINNGQLAFFKEKIAIIDYKTGKSKTIGEIKGIDKNGNKKDGEGKYFRQLMFYKLLCEIDSEFNSKFEIGSLAIDFVEGKDGIYKYIEIDYTPEEYEFFKQELIESRNKITDINFWKELLK